MNLKVVNKSSNNKSIVFFNGWAMDENIVNHLNSNDFDVFMLNEYQTQNTIDWAFLDNYSENILIAWSMGVWAAEQLPDAIWSKITQTIAINGTGLPINNSYGIPTSVFDSTYNNLSEINLQKFFKRVCGNSDVFELFKKQTPKRSYESQKQELKYLKTNARKNETVKEWDLVVISKDDLIFSAKNQMNYWKQSNLQIVEIEASHYPFQIWKSWKEVCNLNNI